MDGHFTPVGRWFVPVFSRSYLSQLAQFFFQKCVLSPGRGNFLARRRKMNSQGPSKDSGGPRSASTS